MKRPMAANPYVNRELSWLGFNQRVLEEAQDPSVPLLERLKFLAITASNLDEFFMVRVGGLHLLVTAGSTKRDLSGMTPKQQLAAIGRRVQTMAAEQDAAFSNKIEPALAGAGMTRVTPDAMTEEQAAYVEELFTDHITAVLTPTAVDRRGRFPLVKNLSLHLAVRLHPKAGNRQPRFAIVPIGKALDRFITLPGMEGFHYILLEDVVRYLAGGLFCGERVAECRAFRITRNADMRVEEDEASDLLAGMEQVLEARKRSDCVRLEIEHGATRALLTFLQQGLDIGAAETYQIPGPLALSDFMKLVSMDGLEHLRYEPWPPQPPPAIDPTVSMFEVLSKQDILLAHPFDSFEPVVRFIKEAAEDPDVLAIKQTLYRTSPDSPIVEALAEAARRGKYVTALVELKARFDEARNIERARELEQEGVQVIWGVKGLKTHSKICIVVRREPRGIVRYMHFGTGNYNEITARLYADISYMTCDETLGADASAFLNAIAGYSEPPQFRKLAVAPIGLRERLIELIQNETERSRQGQKAHIMAKMNSLADSHVIDALYAASQAGVKIRLNVRGICCLCPGVKGLSENISVVSIVDRFLEHSRIFCFSHGGDNKVYISSADWMPRNLDRRVELLIPVEDPHGRQVLVAMLETYFADTVKSRRLLADGTHKRLRSSRTKPRLRSQETLYRRACTAAGARKATRRTMFEPHQPTDR